MMNFNNGLNNNGNAMVGYPMMPQMGPPYYMQPMNFDQSQ
jgi:hypothetical protein